MTTTATLGVAWLWTYVLPVVMLALLFRLVLMLWRVGVTSSVNARRVIAGASLTVLLAAFLLGTPAMPGVPLEVDHSIRVDILRAPPGKSGRERVIYLGAARKITSSEEREKEARAADQTEFNRCMQTLGISEPGSVSPLEEAVRNLTSRVRLADAQDLAYGTLLDVCVKHSKAAISSLREYFWKAVHYARGRFCAKSSRQVEWSTAPSEVESCTAFVQLPETKFFRHAMSQLSERERRALHMHFYEGRSHREIGDDLGISEAAARKLSSRAIGALRTVLGVHEPRLW